MPGRWIDNSPTWPIVEVTVKVECGPEHFGRTLDELVEAVEDAIDATDGLTVLAPAAPDRDGRGCHPEGR